MVMNKKQVNITITPAGTVTVDAVGFQGKACDKATEQIELALGGGEGKRTNKPEYHAAPVTNQQSNRRTF